MLSTQSIHSPQNRFLLDSDFWIEQLALDECQMDELGLASALDDRQLIENLLEQESLRIMEYFRHRVDHLTHLFNQKRQENHSSSIIKVYKISQTINDFMCFRNSLKLIFTRKDPSLIEIGIFGHSPLQKQNHSSFLITPSQIGKEHQGHIVELKAFIGPFQNVAWTYGGDIVEVDTVVKYMLSEFIKNSAK